MEVGVGRPVGSFIPKLVNDLHDSIGSFLVPKQATIASRILSKFSLATVSWAFLFNWPGLSTESKNPESTPMSTITIKSSISVNPGDFLLMISSLYIF